MCVCLCVVYGMSSKYAISKYNDRLTIIEPNVIVRTGVQLLIDVSEVLS